MLGIQRKFGLFWHEKLDGVGSVEVMVKEELCKKMVCVWSVRSNVMKIVFVSVEDVLILIFVYALENSMRLEKSLW